MDTDLDTDLGRIYYIKPDESARSPGAFRSLLCVSLFGAGALREYLPNQSHVLMTQIFRCIDDGLNILSLTNTIVSQVSTLSQPHRKVQFGASSGESSPPINIRSSSDDGRTTCRIGSSKRDIVGLMLPLPPDRPRDA